MPRKSIAVIEGGEEMPSFKCSDMGMQCGFQATAPNTNELLVKVLQHGENAHQMNDLSQKDVDTMLNVMKE